MQSKKNINIEIGANIKREREKAGLTQEKLSEQVGLGTKSLSAIERGTVGISLACMKRICRALSVSSDVLLFGETETVDTSDLTKRLERLTPEQYRIASEIVMKLIEAFHITG